MNVFKEFTQPRPYFKCGRIVPIGTKIELQEVVQHLLWLLNYIYYFYVIPTIGPKSVSLYKPHYKSMNFMLLQSSSYLVS